MARGDDLADCQYGFREGRSTICAISKLLSRVEGSASKKVGVLTFDVRNAFNSASWEKILDATLEKGVCSYIIRVIQDYFRDRKLVTMMDRVESALPVTSGVPQGSVLGPTLWNIMYDGLLREPLPNGEDFLAYADDVALIASGKDVCELERQLSQGAEIVVNWMAATGLELAIHKSEAMVITKTRTHNDLRITIGGVLIKNVKQINYLGIIIDQRVNFTSHAAHVAAKAGKVARNLARILPNVSAATARKRKLLAVVTHSILLYGSPIWSGKMSSYGLTELAKCQRRMTLMVASVYCTVSTDAALVIAGIPPIDLLGSERQTLTRNSGARKADCRATLLSEWQSRWISSSKGR